MCWNRIGTQDRECLGNFVLEKRPAEQPEKSHQCASHHTLAFLAVLLITVRFCHSLNNRRSACETLPEFARRDAAPLFLSVSDYVYIRYIFGLFVVLGGLTFDMFGFSYTPFNIMRH